MATIPELLAAALSLHQARDLDGAEAIYLQVLRDDPRQVDALHLLGLVHHQTGRHEQAAELIGRALVLKPDFAEAHFNLGTAETSLGKPEEAIAHFRRAVHFRPNFPEAIFNLGNALRDAGRPAEAVDAYRQAVRLRPGYVKAYNNLASLLKRGDRLDEAAACHRRVVELEPDSADARNNLGVTLFDLGRLDDSAVCFRAAIELDPDLAAAHRNLGDFHEKQGRPAAAMTCFEEAIRLQPDFAAARLSRALARLAGGDFDRGWPEYEWRWKYHEVTPIDTPRPAWDGSPLDGRTILLHTEQGLGDTLQFVRYAPLVKERGGDVLLRCAASLHPLLSRCAGIDRLVDDEGADLPPFDVHAPLLSLPGLFGTRLETIPAPIPYLHADPALVERWRRALEPIAGCRVGVAWQANLQSAYGRARSILQGLDAFEPLARLDGVRLISLQKGTWSASARAAAARLGVIDPGPDLDEEAGAFMDTAAVMKNLDLVISVDTSFAHLAGALGVDAWVALPTAADWRWLRDREDTPWYPTLRLFRRPAGGDWSSVLGRMAAELKERAAGTAPLAAIHVEIAPGELIDKITILEIKRARVNDPAKVARVVDELDALAAARDRSIRASSAIDELTAELRSINEALWEVEDAIRLCERDGDFGRRFIELARAVYRDNDRRAAVKAAINERLGARFREQKHYTAHRP